jgi:hypothetical protein
VRKRQRLRCAAEWRPRHAPKVAKGEDPRENIAEKAELSISPGKGRVDGVAHCSAGQTNRCADIDNATRSRINQRIRSIARHSPFIHVAAKGAMARNVPLRSTSHGSRRRPSDHSLHYRLVEPVDRDRYDDES